VDAPECVRDRAEPIGIDLAEECERNVNLGWGHESEPRPRAPQRLHGVRDPIPHPGGEVDRDEGPHHGGECGRARYKAGSVARAASSSEERPREPRDLGPDRRVQGEDRAEVDGRTQDNRTDQEREGIRRN